MRTTVDLDETLLREAKELCGGASIKEIVNLSLQEYIRKVRLKSLSEKLGAYDLDLDVHSLKQLRER